MPLYKGISGLDEQLRAAFHEVWARRPDMVLCGDDLIKAVRPYLDRAYKEQSIRVRIALLAQRARSSIYRLPGTQGYRYQRKSSAIELKLVCPDCDGGAKAGSGEICERCKGTGVLES